MAELIAFTVSLNAYKQMFGKNETTDQEFINWVRKETSDIPEVEIDDISGNYTTNYTAKLHELSAMEIQVLTDTIDTIF